MRILVVSATSSEIAPLVMALGGIGNAPGISSTRCGSHDVDLLVSGVGMVATAARVSSALARRTYDMALNFGVCGSFDGALAPGRVVHVVSDRFAELGAEDRGAFLTIHDLKLLGEDEFPFERAELVNHAPPAAVAQLPAVRGITVNTVHGEAASIAAAAARFSPQVESMEGAAFMYACLIERAPFAQVRAVSNIVAPRDRAAWRMADAIDNLGAAAVDILHRL